MNYDMLFTILLKISINNIWFVVLYFKKNYKVINVYDDLF